MVYESKYKWRQGTGHGVDANVAGQVCAELEKKGLLNAPELVRVSTPEDAPLHKCFLWDDQKAATLYREDQARHIIRDIEIVTTPSEPPKRVFYNIRAEEPGYQHIDVIMKNEDKRQLLLEQAKSDMKFFRVKYNKLEELAKVFAAMEEFTEENT